MASLDSLVDGESVNAAASWGLVGVLGLAVGLSLRSNAPLWAGFSCVVLIVAVLPPLASGDRSVMVPWPLLAVAALAVLAGGSGIRPEFAGYVAVATLAILVAVEVDVFTGVEMSRRFAVAFAVLATLAVQALWTIAQYGSDLWLGTDLLTTQRELQVDIVLATVVGLAMGAAAVWYLRRVDLANSPDRQRTDSRYP